MPPSVPQSSAPSSGRNECIPLTPSGKVGTKPNRTVSEPSTNETTATGIASNQSLTDANQFSGNGASPALGGYNTPGIYGAGPTMYGGAGGLGYSGLYGGLGGGMVSPYYGMMPTGPLSGMNQFLFSVQSVIFSLGQAVQIIGMNTQALRQLVDAATAMFDHAVQTWNEMRALEAQSRHSDSEEDRKRRARLRALRMALVAGISYLGYRLIRKLWLPQRQRPRAALAAPPQGYNAAAAGHYYPSGAYGPNGGLYR